MVKEEGREEGRFGDREGRRKKGVEWKERRKNKEREERRKERNDGEKFRKREVERYR